MLSIRRSTIGSCSFRKSSKSPLTWRTDDVPLMVTAFRVIATTSWNPHSLSLPCSNHYHREQLLRRLRFSTSAARKDEPEIKIDVLSKKQKNAYICKSIYRQMLRWCQNYHQQLYPPDLIQYFTKVPKQYTLVPHLFPSHEYVHQKFIQWQPKLWDRTGKMEEADHQPHPSTITADSSASDNQNDGMERVFSLLKDLPMIHYNNENPSQCLIISIRSITDVQSCIRAVYRMNAYQSHADTHCSTDDTSSSNHQKEVEDFEKLCRNVAFEEMKHMNEILVELQKCQQHRHNRQQNVFPFLQQHFDDCTRKNIEIAHKILPIGQVVQHKEDHWRGVIVHWSYDDGNPQRTKFPSHKKSLSTTVRDDFTSLTLKSYTAPIEDDYDTSGSTSNSKSTDPHHRSSVDIPEHATSIVYEIILDDDAVLEEYEDEDDEYISKTDNAASSVLMKRHLLHTHQKLIPTFITIRQPLFDASRHEKTCTDDENSKTSMTSSSSSKLEVVQDKHLCRIHNA